MKEVDRLLDSNTIELLEKACNQDERAFEILVERFTPKLKAIARFYLDLDHDMEDVIQEVWIKAYRNLHTLKEPRKLLYWLARITKYSCIDKKRIDAKKRNDVSLDDETRHYLIECYMENNEDLSCYLEKEELKTVINNALKDLPETYSLPISLYYLENMKLKEIEEILGLTSSTVKWRLYHGRLLLRKSMSTYIREG
jgi:RNA polymerase sigma-70 factor (ECF subfamily)